jgi:hypothetical protein
MRTLDLDVYRFDNTVWDFSKGKIGQPFESVILTVRFHFNFPQKQAIAVAADILLAQSPHWFLSGGYKWTFDLDRLRSSIEVCSDLEWLRGKITVEPEYKLEHGSNRDITSLIVTLMPEDLSKELFQKHTSGTSEDLLPSLSKFHKDYPNPKKTGFIIMQFTATKAHDAILRSVKATLAKFSLNGLRADEKEYADEILANIRTYMHGCDFGVAVFERLMKDEFNPNMALEVGYMMAQGKPVLLLKDKTLKYLHTDIVGKLYRDFDPQNPDATIPSQLESWLRDKGLVD